MCLQVTYRGSEVQRFAQEPPPYGTGWRQVACEVETVFIYVSEPGKPGHHFVQRLAYEADGNEVGRKKVGGWERNGQRSGRS